MDTGNPEAQAALRRSATARGGTVPLALEAGRRPSGQGHRRRALGAARGRRASTPHRLPSHSPSAPANARPATPRPAPTLPAPACTQWTGQPGRKGMGEREETHRAPGRGDGGAVE